MCVIHTRYGEFGRFIYLLFQLCMKMDSGRTTDLEASLLHAAEYLYMVQGAGILANNPNCSLYDIVAPRLLPKEEEPHVEATSI